MKLIGAGLIILSCYYIGSVTANNRLYAFRQLQGIIRLLEYLEQRITYSGERLPQVFANFEDNALERCGFMEILRCPKGKPYHTLWEEACQTTCLEQNILRELEDFGNGLGRLDLESQKEKISLCRNTLVLEKDRQEPLLSPKMKSGKALGALAGAMIALILL